METEGLSKKRICLYIEQNLWREFKKICFREDIPMSNKVEAFVSRYVAVHMKGNPQLLLEKFTEPTKNICYFCRGSFPELIPVKFISGIKRKLCKECIEQEKAKGSYCRIKRIYG